MWDEKSIKKSFLSWAKRNLSREEFEAIRSGEITVFSYWDLKTEQPAVGIYLNGESRDFIWDPEEKTWYEVNWWESPLDEFDIWNLEELRTGNPLPASIPSVLYETLIYYGSPFVLIVPLKDWWVRIKGRFIDNTVEYFLPDRDEYWDDLIMWLDKNRRRVWKILMTYEWKSVDLFRGYYTSCGDGLGWRKVVEGWVGWGSSHKTIELLDKLSKMDVDGLPDYPILFVFPRSSNLMVVYFDVWVPKDAAKDFIAYLDELHRKMFNEPLITDDFSFYRGYNIRIGLEL